MSSTTAIAAEHEALWMLGFFYLRNGRPEKAQTIFAALLYLLPDEPRLSQALALAQIRAGKAGQALATLDALALKGRIDAVFHLLRAQALDAQGSRAEAARAMRAFVDSRATALPAQASDDQGLAGNL